MRLMASRTFPSAARQTRSSFGGTTDARDAAKATSSLFNADTNVAGSAFEAASFSSTTLYTSLCRSMPPPDTRANNTTDREWFTSNFLHLWSKGAAKPSTNRSTCVAPSAPPVGSHDS